MHRAMRLPPFDLELRLNGADQSWPRLFHRRAWVPEPVILGLILPSRWSHEPWRRRGCCWIAGRAFAVSRTFTEIPDFEEPERVRMKV